MTPGFNENWRLQSILKGVGKRPEKSVQRSNVCFQSDEPEIIGHYGGDIYDDDDSDCDSPHQNGNDLPDCSGGLFSCQLYEPTGIFCLIMLVFWLNEPSPHFCCHNSSKLTYLVKRVEKILLACCLSWKTV